MVVRNLEKTKIIVSRKSCCVKQAQCFNESLPPDINGHDSLDLELWIWVTWCPSSWTTIPRSPSSTHFPTKYATNWFMTRHRANNVVVAGSTSPMRFVWRMHTAADQQYCEQCKIQCTCVTCGKRYRQASNPVGGLSSPPPPTLTHALTKSLTHSPSLTHSLNHSLLHLRHSHHHLHTLQVGKCVNVKYKNYCTRMEERTALLFLLSNRTGSTRLVS